MFKKVESYLTGTGLETDFKKARERRDLLFKLKGLSKSKVSIVSKKDRTLKISANLGK